MTNAPAPVELPLGNINVVLGLIDVDLVSNCPLDSLRFSPNHFIIPSKVDTSSDVSPRRGSASSSEWAFPLSLQLSIREQTRVAI